VEHRLGAQQQNKDSHDDEGVWSSQGNENNLIHARIFLKDICVSVMWTSFPSFEFPRRYSRRTCPGICPSIRIQSVGLNGMAVTAGIRTRNPKRRACKTHAKKFQQLPE
jgi:hypothetical protein